MIYRKFHKRIIYASYDSRHTEGKIVINDNIIEQITDFKYLAYRIQNTKVI